MVTGPTISTVMVDGIKVCVHWYGFPPMDTQELMGCRILQSPIIQWLLCQSFDRSRTLLRW